MNINEVRKLIYKHGEKIGLLYDSKLYPIFSSTGNVFSDGGTIYISNNEYHYVLMERGKENKHYRSLDINDILYPLFEGITFSLASKYELKNRNEKEDPRKLLWSKQLELLGKIDPLFKERCQKEIDSILKIAPYKKCNWQKIDVYGGNCQYNSNPILLWESGNMLLVSCGDVKPLGRTVMEGFNAILGDV